MATAAATMTMATQCPRSRAPLRVCAAWDMNPGAATVATPKPSKAKAKPPPPPVATPARPPPPTHADLFARSSEGQGVVKKSTYMGFEKWWLPPPPQVKKPRSLYSAASLVYLGDCIYELYARRHFFFPPLSINEYNKRVMDVVKCESQDLLLNKLLGEDFLTEEERDILRWGRNIVSSKTRTRKRAGIAVYNRASSLETLTSCAQVSSKASLENNPCFRPTSTTCNKVNSSRVTILVSRLHKGFTLVLTTSQQRQRGRMSHSACRCNSMTGGKWLANTTSVYLSACFCKWSNIDTHKLWRLSKKQRL